MNDEEIWLHTLCQKNRVSITDIQLAQLSSFKSLLLDWNKKINLVSRKQEESIWKGQIALSISLVFKVILSQNMKILDLGTGGGLPGIPLAIMHPECSFTLLDSTQKKITAVQSMIASLGLQNIQTVWGRAEDIQKKPLFFRSFDAIIARSVSNLTNLLDWGLPFLKPLEGENIVGEKISIATPSLITFKGSEINQEEQSATEKYPNISFLNVPLIFSGSEEFDNLDKKLLIATVKNPR